MKEISPDHDNLNSHLDLMKARLKKHKKTIIKSVFYSTFFVFDIAFLVLTDSSLELYALLIVRLLLESIIDYYL